MTWNDQNDSLMSMLAGPYEGIVDLMALMAKPQNNCSQTELKAQGNQHMKSV